MSKADLLDALRMMMTAPSSREWWRFAAVLVGLGGLVGAGEFVRRFFQWSPEFTRKLVHVSVGLVVFFAPTIFVVPLPAILLASIFILVNYFAIRLDLLKGMHDTERRSYGTVYYPLSFLILVLLFWYTDPIVISCSILVLALADAAAAIVGESVRSPILFRLSSDKKSIQGSAAMAVVSFVSLLAAIVLLTHDREYSIGLIVAAAGVGAATATACEALSSKGLDNLTIPLSVAFVLWAYLHPSESVDSSRLTLGAGFAVAVAGSAYALKMLKASGGVATFLLALAVFGIGGWQWTVPILTFFIPSSLLSRLGTEQKAGVQEKGNTRDYGQVFANGGVAGILVIASSVYSSPLWYPMYLGSLAAATADTWSTEIGLLGGGTPLLVTTFQRVERGRNGGVTWQGIGGALAGSVLLTASGLFWIKGIDVALIVLASGVFGSVVDSLLGATVQAEYRCPVCNSTTEGKIHCNGQPTILAKGREWMTNDAVNWACAISGAIFVCVIV